MKVRQDPIERVPGGKRLCYRPAASTGGPGPRAGGPSTPSLRGVVHQCGKALWIRMAQALSEIAARDVWSHVEATARAQLPENIFAMWFSAVRPAGYVDDTLTLEVASPLVRERLQHNYLRLISHAAAAAGGRPVKVVFRIAEGLRRDLATDVPTEPGRAPLEAPDTSAVRGPAHR